MGYVHGKLGKKGHGMYSKYTTVCDSKRKYAKHSPWRMRQKSQLMRHEVRGITALHRVSSRRLLLTVRPDFPDEAPARTDLS